MLLEPAIDAWYGLSVSLVDLVSFSSDLAHHLLQQPRAALRILDASAVAAQEVLLLRGALAAANTVLPI